MDLQFDFIYKDKTYPVEVTYKDMKNIRYRFRDGFFVVTCPKRCKQSQIEEGLKKFAGKLIKSDGYERPISDSYIYFLGYKIYPSKNGGTIQFENGFNLIYKDFKDLEAKLLKLFKETITNRHRYYEAVMDIKKPYKITVRAMVSRYGSNSLRTRRITYTKTLMHYSVKIIDAIIVHELAHEFQRNHSKKFYDIVKKYYKDYDVYHRKLKKGEYS